MKTASILKRVLRPQHDVLTISLIAVGLALAIGLAVIYATGRDGLAGYAEMFSGGLGGAGPLGESSIKMTVLTLTGLSVAVAFVVGLFNIGAEGQLIVGAITAAWLGRAVTGLPAALHLPLVIGAAMAAGAFWGFLPGYLKLKRGVHEVISTIMLNWVAVYIVENWLVIGPLKAPESSDASISLSGTGQIQHSAELPRLLGDASRLNLGFLLALAAAGLCLFVLSRTRLGYELRAVGASAEAARYGGINVASRIYVAMSVAGALAGLGGATLILGTELRYPSSFHSGYGFDGIAVSLIGGNNPLGVLIAAAFFSVLRAGGTRLQLLQIHRSLPDVIQGLALLFVAGQLAFRAGLRRLRARAFAPGELPDA
jgi:general nucleoside transport system permease protein